MARDLVVASHNEGKVREIRELLAPLGFTTHSAAALNLAEPEETGDTFEANAELKARAAALAANMSALADDSGLVIPALDGAPGIYSARWASEAKDFTVAMARVERELTQRGLTPIGTAAYFVCALSFVDAAGAITTVRGEAHGTLTFPARGTHGFGYDPIFVPNNCRHTFGEMAAEEKKHLSHRTQAFHALLSQLERELAA